MSQPDRSYQAAVGRRLEAIRLYHRVSLNDAAALTGYKPWTLRSWEAGRRNMRIEDLARIAEAYGYDTWELLPEGLGDVA